MDWIGTIATAVVGLAGIGATMWISMQDRRSRQSEAVIDEKRRAYAVLFASSDRVVAAASRVRFLRRQGYTGEPFDQALSDMEDAKIAHNTAAYEVKLIAPPAVDDHAERLRDALRARVVQAESTDDGPDVPTRPARARLINAMRADLGQTALPEDPQP